MTHQNWPKRLRPKQPGLKQPRAEMTGPKGPVTFVYLQDLAFIKCVVAMSATGIYLIASFTAMRSVS